MRVPYREKERENLNDKTIAKRGETFCRSDLIWTFFSWGALPQKRWAISLLKKDWMMWAQFFPIYWGLIENDMQSHHVSKTVMT